MASLKKTIYVFFSTLFFVSVFFPVTKANAMESKKETTIYVMYVSSENCFFTLYLNDLQITAGKSTTPISTGFTIGEYLKPKDNILKLEVWDPDSEPGQWREGAKCTVYIEAADPGRALGPEAVTEINFYPPHKPDLTKPEEFFYNITQIDTALGKSLTSPEVSYSSETGHYTLNRAFDVRENYIEWSWYNSAVLSEPLLIEQKEKLQNAYQRVWTALSNRDLPAMRKAYHEMMFESAMANNSTEESYFDSANFQNYFEDEFLQDFVLMPLSFTERQLKFSLDQKVVQMEPTPLLFCPKEYTGENFDLRRCYQISPKFRFTGEEFVIAR